MNNKRYIDGDAVLNTLDLIYKNACTQQNESYLAGLSLASALLKAQPTELEWIFTKNELPADNRKVLMCHENGFIEVGSYYAKKWKWIDLYNAIQFDIIAWMELPEAPIVKFDGQSGAERKI